MACHGSPYHATFTAPATLNARRWNTNIYNVWLPMYANPFTRIFGAFSQMKAAT